MPQTSVVLLIVLATAVLHAGWNAAVKAIGDRWAATLLMGTVFAAAGLVAIMISWPRVGLPATPSWPFLVGSAVVQCGYLVLLTRAYKSGAMSQLYPIARGTSPVVVTLVAVGFLSERLSATAWLGLAVLVGALGVLIFARGRPQSGTGVGLAVLTGLTIATYTLIDGVGVRQAGEPLAYIAWGFAIHGLLLILLSLRCGGPGLVRRARLGARLGVFGGVMSVLSYGIVVWAQAHAPLALVSAMRETSVVWALLVARVSLGERLDRRAIAAVVLAAAGAIMVQLA